MGGDRFRSYQPEQMYLLPPSIDDWLPHDHLVYFVRDVVEQLELGSIYAGYELEQGGQPPHDPRMMVTLLLYAYSVGVFSSRKIERGTYESVPFRVASADQHPDHATIARFRKRHLGALGSLFVQVLRLCQRAGLVKLGHVALDSTKVKANASKHKAMSYGHMVKSERELEREVARLLHEADRQDEAEQRRYGAAGGEEELPKELRFKEQRLRRIREAKEALEQEARERAERQSRQRDSGEGGARGGAATGGERSKPKEKAQRNFTDPDSRIMMDKAVNGFRQCYSCQTAVDEKAQVIVAARVSQQGNDSRQLVPMSALIRGNTGGKLPRRMSADSGYYNGEHVDALKERMDLYIATEKWKHRQGPPKPRGRIPRGLSAKQLMGRKVRTQRGREIYGRRKEIVEPVFGQIKEAQAFRQFLLRGLSNVQREWQLVCTTHNLLKLFRSGWAPSTA